MIGLLAFILTAVVLSFFFKLLRKSTWLDEDGDFKPVNLVKLFGVLFVAAIVGIFIPIELERVDSGKVAILVDNVGDNRGMARVEYRRGWVLYNSFTQRYYEFPVYQQHIDYEENTVITKGGFQATIKPSFNYSLNPTTVDQMFQNLRLDIKQVEQGWLKNAIVSSVNDVANLFTVDSIFNHRAEFEAAIVGECNKRVGKWFTVSQLRTNIAPPPAITAAIEEKTKAVQEAQAAVMRKTVAEAEAQEKIARAKGDSAEAVITASGNAEAVLKVQRVLNPVYVEYIKWLHAGENVPRVPSTILGSNGNVLLNHK